jgi:hypothetical protein
MEFPRNLPLPRAVPLARWIPLSKGMFVLIDESDFEDISKHKWTVMTPGRCAYAYRRPLGKVILLHRYLMDAPAGMEVDHINGNGLDCRRSNMRVCTRSQNFANRNKCSVKKTSIFKGVWWDSTRAKWASAVKKNGKKICLGRFDTPEQAAHVYDKAAIRYFGKYAKLNYPMDRVSYTRQLFRLGLAWV